MSAHCLLTGIGVGRDDGDPARRGSRAHCQLVTQHARLAVTDAGEREGDEHEQGLCGPSGSSRLTSSSRSWFTRVKSGAWSFRCLPSCPCALLVVVGGESTPVPDTRLRRAACGRSSPRCHQSVRPDSAASSDPAASRRASPGRTVSSIWVQSARSGSRRIRCGRDARPVSCWSASDGPHPPPPGGFALPRSRDARQLREQFAWWRRSAR